MALPSLRCVQVSIIIPLYNCLPLTQAMLASLRTTLPEGLEHEIILVDDGSTDGTREWLPAAADARTQVILNPRNLGYARSNNRGVQLARGQLLLLLNNDLLLLPRWFENLVAAHASLGTRAGAVGNVQFDARTGVVDHAGIVINFQGKPVHARALPRWRMPWSAPVLPVPAVTGACLLIERALWDELGGFDEAYLNGGEDIDLCFRARAIGRENAVALRSVIRHCVSSSSGRKARDEENSYRLARRWSSEFLAAAEYGAHQWSCMYLADALYDPHALEFPTALRALAHATGLRRSRPPEADLALRSGLQREFDRWERMFPNAGAAT